jgi:membrane fusion protein, heavy metal efflux system
MIHLPFTFFEIDYKWLGALALGAVFAACQPQTEPTNNSAGESTASTAIVLTPEQAQTIDVQTQPIEMRSLSGTVKANGMLDVPPQNLVSIAAPMGGFVRHTDLLQGMKVTKGQVVAEMEHPDYIQLQQDYLDGKSQLEFLSLELARQQELARENVNATKTLQQAKSNYESMKAKVAGWRARLRMINLSTETIEKDGIQPLVRLTSPISGYVTRVHVNIGMFVNPNDELFKIVDTDHLHAEVTVFEKDVSRIKAGQLIRLTLSNETTERQAKVYLVGKEISEDRTVRVHGHLQKEDGALLPGMFFSCVIETSPQQVPTLPQQAILPFAGKNFVFVSRGENKFEWVEVQIGVTENGFAEVQVPADIAQATFVVKGAYDLLGMLQNTGEEE